MAFPGVAAVNGGNNTSNSANHTVNLPSGISAGNLLLVLFSADGNPTISFPAGWTELFQTASGTAVKFGAWYRIADGGEGSTIVVTTSQSQESAHTSYRLTSTNVFHIAAGTPATGDSDSPNPPGFSPVYGAKDYVWFAVCGSDKGVVSVSSYPTDYTNGRNDTAGNANGCGVGSAYRELNVSSEDPGTFGLSNSEEWVANTIMISNADIDVGSAAIDRSNHLTCNTYTAVEGANPANETGVIDTAEIYIQAGTAVLQVWVGMFSASGNTLTCRDSENTGDVDVGFNIQTGLDIDAELDDHIGIHERSEQTCNIDYATSGGVGFWYKSGDYIDPSDSATFSWVANFILSLYGTGETAGGWSNIVKVGGVTATDLAKVDGVVVANIAKICGVAV